MIVPFRYTCIRTTIDRKSQPSTGRSYIVDSENKITSLESKKFLLIILQGLDFSWWVFYLTCNSNKINEIINYWSDELAYKILKLIYTKFNSRKW